MSSSFAQIRVWIECPACGSYDKLERLIRLPFEVSTPLFEKTFAVCDRCRDVAEMCFERKAVRRH